MWASRPRAASQVSAESLRSSALRLPGTTSESAALLGARFAPNCSSGATFEMQIAEPAKMVDARKDSMDSLFGLWIEQGARLAGRGPALPQKGCATAGHSRTYAVCATLSARIRRV